ncbi:MAG TPA: histone deacetylase [Thermomicrobiales bacterium]|jgi:acetoin utilization deacetylase AcuC-like enzyme
MTNSFGIDAAHTACETPDMNRTPIVYSDHYLDHHTGPHPETERRLVAIIEHLDAEGLLVDRPLLTPTNAPREAILRVHDAAYVDALERFCAAGGGWLEPSTVVSAESFDVALLAAGGAIRAVDTVLTGEAARVFALIRPPGHHATAETGMGFCLFNNVAVAAQYARDHYGLERVAIIDWDIHHGNGTNDIFYDDPHVLFVSTHQHPLYPGSGLTRERGTGEGEGYTLNIPLPPRSNDADYLRVFDDLIGPLILSYQPELLFISAGYDAAQDDPLAEMLVSDAGFRQMAERAVAWADTCCAGRIVALLEGGYDLAALARGVAVTLRVLDGEPNPPPLP